MHVTPERYRQVAIASLVALFVVIVAGAAVRLTNSGLGCDDWPNCNETTLRRRVVEARRDRAGQPAVQRDRDGGGAGRRRRSRTGCGRGPAARSSLAWTLVALVAANAVLGGISVLVDLHPLAIQGHLLLALAALVVNLVLIARCSAAAGRRASVSRRSMRLVWCVVAGTAAAIVAGTLVTGSGPHAGDEDAPTARPRHRVDRARPRRDRDRDDRHRAGARRCASTPGRRSARRSPTPCRSGCSSGSLQARDRLHPVLQRPPRVARRRARGRCGGDHAGDQPTSCCVPTLPTRDGSTVRTLEVGAAAT